jgi:hypothetical protein
MTKLAMILTLAVAAAGPVYAKGCMTNCALVDALALTKLCPNLTLNHDGEQENAASPPSGRMLREEVDLYMGQIAKAKDICHPACFSTKDATWPCNYLQERPVKPLQP